MQNRNDYYVCKRLRLCHFLLMKGFNFDSYRPDKYNPKYLVWLFKNSDKLQSAVSEYYERIDEKQHLWYNANKILLKHLLIGYIKLI